MKKSITRCDSGQSSKNKIKKVKDNVLGPCEETLVLIRQFARIYQIESSLESGLSTYLMN